MASPDQFEETAFVRAGISKMYLRQTLNRMKPYSQPALDYVQREDFADELRDASRGIVVSGDAPQSWVIVHLLAKSAMVRSVTCRVVTLHRLIQHVTEDGAAFEEVPALFVPNFVGDGDTNPYPVSQVAAVEDYLVSHIHSGGSLVIGVPSGWKGAWWSPTMFKFMAETNARIDL